MTDPITPETWEPPEEMAPVFLKVADALSLLSDPSQTPDDVSATLAEEVRTWGWPHAWVLLQSFAWYMCHGMTCPCAVAHPWIEAKQGAAFADSTSSAEG